MSLPFARYDRRAYPTLDVASGYTAWSCDYDETVDDELDLALLVRLESVPWREVGAAADLGCGTGRAGVWLKGRGPARLFGVDLCAAMLERAARKRAYQLLVRAELTRTPLPGGAFDLVLSVLAGCHLPSVAAFYEEAARLLGKGAGGQEGAGGRHLAGGQDRRGANRAGRYLVMIDYHPFFLMQGIPTHFIGPAGEPVAILNFVHQMSEQVEAGRRSGFELVEMRERVVDEVWTARRPSMGKYLGQPASFALAWRLIA